MLPSNNITSLRQDKALTQRSETAKMQIRQAALTDLEMLFQYTLKLHQHEDDGLIAAHDKFQFNLKKWLSLELNNQRSLFLIAENIAGNIAENDAENNMNSPIGFIGATSILNDNGFLACPLKGFIQLLWVEKTYRKKAIAARLVAQIESCFQQIGVEYVECSYTCVNHLAESFWDKQGYDKQSITARKFI